MRTARGRAGNGDTGLGWSRRAGFSLFTTTAGIPSPIELRNADLPASRTGYLAMPVRRLLVSTERFDLDVRL